MSEYLRVRGVRAVMIFSPDPSESAAWWGRLLGLPVRADRAFRWLETANGVELGFHPADTDKNPPGASTVIYWRVDALDDAIGQAVALGARLHRGPLDVGGGRRIAQIEDPFGAIFGLDGF